MNKEVISIIVPVYKAEQFIDRCVESILNQTYKSIELVLVDDGSPDKSGELCERWKQKDDRVKVIHKENGGASSARNLGLKIATGKFVGFVDSDDWIDPMMYQRLYELLERYDADMSICEIKVAKDGKVHSTQKQIKTSVWTRKEALNHFFRVNGEKDSHSVCTRLIKRSLLQEFEFIEGKMNEDVHACYYLAEKCRTTVYTNEAFYNYYLNVDGVTNSRFTEKKLDLLDVWKIVEKMVLELSPEYIEVCMMNCKRARFTLLSQMYLNGFDKDNTFLVQKKKQLKKEVRAAYFDLLRWKMPISRKVLLTLIVI